MVIYHSTKHGDIEVATMQENHLGFAARKLRKERDAGTIDAHNAAVLQEMEAVARKNNWTIPS
jgi:hypothetical protein